MRRRSAFAVALTFACFHCGPTSATTIQGRQPEPSQPPEHAQATARPLHNGHKEETLPLRLSTLGSTVREGDHTASQSTSAVEGSGEGAVSAGTGDGPTQPSKVGGGESQHSAGGVSRHGMSHVDDDDDAVDAWTTVSPHRASNTTLIPTFKVTRMTLVVIVVTSLLFLSLVIVLSFKVGHTMLLELLPPPPRHPAARSLDEIRKMKAAVKELLDNGLPLTHYGVSLRFDSDSDATGEMIPPMSPFVCPDGDDCAVCLEPFEHMDTTRTLRCGHFFHPECIDPWLLQNSPRCPLCKDNVLAYTSYAPPRPSPSPAAPDPADDIFDPFDAADSGRLPSNPLLEYTAGGNRGAAVRPWRALNPRVLRAASAAAATHSTAPTRGGSGGGRLVLGEVDDLELLELSAIEARGSADLCSPCENDALLSVDDLLVDPVVDDDELIVDLDLSGPGIPSRRIPDWAAAVAAESDGESVEQTGLPGGLLLAPMRSGPIGLSRESSFGGEASGGRDTYE